MQKFLPETIEKGDGVTIKAELKGKETSYSADKVLVSVGRQPIVEGIGLENTAVELNRGFIQANEYFLTNEPRCLRNW